MILPFSVFLLLDFVVTSREVSSKLCRLPTSLVFTRRHSDFWWEGMSGTSAPPDACDCLCCAVFANRKGLVYVNWVLGLLGVLT